MTNFWYAEVADMSGLSSQYVLAHANIIVVNETAGSLAVQLDGQFTCNGSNLYGTVYNLLHTTMPAGDKIHLHDQCIIERGNLTGNGYRVFPNGYDEPSVYIQVTFVEVDAAGACCIGGS